MFDKLSIAKEDESLIELHNKKMKEMEIKKQEIEARKSIQAQIQEMREELKHDPRHPRLTEDHREISERIDSSCQLRSLP
jgi:cytidylate kinase